MSVRNALVPEKVPTPRPAARAGAFVLVLALLAGACHAPERKAPMSPSRPLTEVLAAHTPGLMAIPGVAGTAESRTSDGRPCILVLLVSDDPALRAKLPNELEGWPVRFEVSGQIRAMPDSGR